jgi:hypothetical protein
LLICLEPTFSGPPLGNSIEGDKGPHIGNQLDNAHKQFGSVLRLNILLATINGAGHPTLRWKTSDPPDAKKTKSGYSLLKYVTTILVRNSEIIAAMAHKTGPSPSSTDSFPEPAPYQVNVMCTVLAREPVSRTVQTDQGEALCPAITAVANLETVRGKDPYFKMASPSVNCLEVPGKSHLKRDSNELRVLESFLKIR